MKHLVLYLLSLIVIVGCNQKNEVVIGNQIWMSENLDVETFKNGDIIAEVKTIEEWEKAWKKEQPAWCYYDNNSQSWGKYGKLYNWYAVSDPRGLAPEGWKVPDINEWNELIEFLQQSGNAIEQLKANKEWYRGAGTNKSKFNALPGGNRDHDWAFHGVGISAGWWSTSQTDEGLIKVKWHHYEHEEISEDEVHPGSGFSVRCLKK
jgi:uncharacterized protein (TIGR02145 family)